MGTLQRPEVGQPENGASLGDQDACDVPLGLPISWLGQTRLAGMVQLGDSVAPGADQEGGPDDQKTSRRDRYSRGDRGNQRPSRGLQHHDPEDQAGCERLSKPRTIQGRYLLPPRRPRLVSGCGHQMMLPTRFSEEPIYLPERIIGLTCHLELQVTQIDMEVTDENDRNIIVNPDHNERK